MIPPKHLTLTTKGVPVHAWIDGVAFDPGAEQQLRKLAEIPVVGPFVAVMPDVHVGKGATVGSVVPTRAAILPAAVGVDIGCGMIAQKTTLRAEHLPDDLAGLRSAIEARIPHGRSSGARDKGSWHDLPRVVEKAWCASLKAEFSSMCEKHPTFAKSNSFVHLGTLGTGNHFVEVCLDESDQVWVMLHSGSRGVGNLIGQTFIEKAREEALRLDRRLPDRDLAWLDRGTEVFDDYVRAVGWAQRFAKESRALMLAAALDALRGWAEERGLPPFEALDVAVNCHHNYVAEEDHFGEKLLVTRKGAVRAGLGDLGIIPGSMGTRSYIVRGKGNPLSLSSCSHGAGRVHSRTKARELFTLEDHARATAGIECRKDEAVIDETPMAYKPIDAVMKAQDDLVDIVHELRQVVCVKG
ncbi:MAG TPA: RtcB family protein [Polyangiaceae bacterium]|nr:RtcB family protein [Polyangiaceae bacterium]